MKTETKVFSGILIFSAILIAGAIFLLSKTGNSSQNQTALIYQIDYSTGHKIGTDSARIKLVEFSDFQCPACKSFEPFLRQVLAEYQNDILFVYKHFPLPQHPNATVAANFAEYAAEEGKFWEAHDKLFDTQEQWSTLKSPNDFFISLGNQLGLDEAKVREALEKLSFNQMINQNLAEGKTVDVTATPSLYLNGQKLKLQNFTDLKEVIRQNLNK